MLKFKVGSLRKRLKKLRNVQQQSFAWISSKSASNHAFEPHSLPQIEIYCLNRQHIPHQIKNTTKVQNHYIFQKQNVLNSGRNDLNSGKMSTHAACTLCSFSNRCNTQANKSLSFGLWFTSDPGR